MGKLTLGVFTSNTMKTLVCLLFAFFTIKTNATCDYTPENYEPSPNGTFPNVEGVDTTSLCNLKDKPIQSSSEIHGKVWFVRSDSKMNWHAGKQFCESKGLKMARIYNTEENEAVFQMEKRLGESIFLGGSAPEGTSGINGAPYKCMFTWWSGDKVGDIGWHSAQPDNHANREWFMEVAYSEHISEASNSWNDINGDDHRYVACEYRINFNVDYILGQEHENPDSNCEANNQDQNNL